MSVYNSFLRVSLNTPQNVLLGRLWQPVDSWKDSVFTINKGPKPVVTERVHNHQSIKGTQSRNASSWIAFLFMERRQERNPFSKNAKGMGTQV